MNTNGKPIVLRRTPGGFEHLTEVDHGLGVITSEWCPVEVVWHGDVRMTEGPGLAPYYKTTIDWRTVDWNKSSMELAAELGVSHITVGIKRKQFGHPKLGNSTYRHIDWDAQDWSKNNQELSGLLHVAPGVVAQYRFKFRKGRASPENKYKDNRKLTYEMLATVDWVKERDIDIANKFGVSRERVRQIRQERGHPDCVFRCRGFLNRTEVFREWALKHRAELEGMLAREAARMGPEKLKLAVERKYVVFRELGIKLLERRPRGNSVEMLPVNWGLPGVLLNSIWDKNDNWAQLHRYRLNKGKQKWRPSPFKGRLAWAEFPGLEEAVMAEVVKAVKLGVSPRWDKLQLYGFIEKKQASS